MVGRPRKHLAPPQMEVVQPIPPKRDLVEVTCITHNVHLGDGRELGWQESAMVEPALADFLVERKQVKRG